jgi:hypothetical protein
MNPLGFFGLHGIPIIAQTVGFEKTMREQVHFPRSKKRRIRKKWAKRPANWKVTVTPLECYMQVGGVIYMHPVVLERLRRELDDHNSTADNGAFH